MVVVEVGDQDGIDAAQRTGVDLGHAAKVSDTVPQEWVREEANATKVDESRGVPHVLDGGAGQSGHSAILRPEPGIVRSRD